MKNIMAEFVNGEIRKKLTGDISYRHEQITASATWQIVHNLGKEPVIQVFDSTGREVKGIIAHDSLIQSTVSFKSQFAGHANCS